MTAPTIDPPATPIPKTPAKTIRTFGSEVSYALHFMREHAGFLLLGVFGVLMPLWGFGALVERLHKHEIFPFDAPVLNMLHALSTPALDGFFVWMSRIGSAWGIVPVDVIVLLWLALRRRYRDTLFFGLAVIGSELIDFAAKNYFARMRPSLWLSIRPEMTYSFPSGHAMGSASLGVALILLFWRTSWRWSITPVVLGFVLLIGISRIYLGVHFPSDILAGWSAATVWVVGMHQLVDRTAPPPPVAVAGTDTVGTGPGAVKPDANALPLHSAGTQEGQP